MIFSMDQSEGENPGREKLWSRHTNINNLWEERSRAMDGVNHHSDTSSGGSMYVI